MYGFDLCLSASPYQHSLCGCMLLQKEGQDSSRKERVTGKELKGTRKSRGTKEVYAKCSARDVSFTYFDTEPGPATSHPSS